YNANSKPSFEYNNVFKRRFFGRDIKERSSLAIEYMYDMKIGKDWFPFLFSSITYSHAPVNRITYTPADYFSTGEAAYRRKESESFPMDAFEFYGGLGLRFILNENFYIYQLAAVGYNYFNKFHMVDTPLIANMGEFGAKFRIGIGYTFGSVTN
ncbi:MAG: hypothetical protein J7L96_07965, partial [Bacteroidales bacterium]|nr:hypothetical protein [Bacteroidales bacterium]